jgi:hypothetical protein
MLASSAKRQRQAHQRALQIERRHGFVALQHRVRARDAPQQRLQPAMHLKQD